MGENIVGHPKLDDLLGSAYDPAELPGILDFTQAMPGAVVAVFAQSQALWANRAYWQLAGIEVPPDTVVTRGEVGWLRELSSDGWIYEKAVLDAEKDMQGVARIILPGSKKLRVNIHLKEHSGCSEDSSFFLGSITPHDQLFDRRSSKDSVYRLKYERLCLSMQEGFFHSKVICDRVGKPIDIRILSVNPAFCKMFDLAESNIINRTVKEVIPGMEGGWIEKLGRVGVQGGSETFREYSHIGNRYYSITAYQSSEGYVACFFIDMTRQVEYARGLMGKNSEWQNTFDSVEEMIAILDKDCNIVHCNKSLSALVGLEPPDLIGRKCYEIFHNTINMPVICPMAQLLQDGQKHDSAFYEEHLGMFLEITVSPLKNAEGELVGSVHVARDVTRKKETEQALRESESRFRLLFENMNLGFALLELQLDSQEDFTDCICLELNPAAEHILGIGVEDIIGKKFRAHYPQIWDEWYTAASQVVQTGVPRMFDYHLENTDRYYKIWLFSSGGPRLAVLFNDVSTTMQANEQLHLKSAALEASYNGIAISDAQGHIIYANNAFHRIWDSGENRDVRELPFLHTAQAEDALRLTVETGQWQGSNIHTALNCEGKPSRDVITNISMSLVEQLSSAESFIITIVLDVTLQNQLESEATRRREQLIHADKLATVGTLVACIMHEVNNPVGVISLNAPILQTVWESLCPLLDQMAKDNQKLMVGRSSYHKIRDYIPQLLSGILDASERINRIIKKLKDFSRPDTSNQKSEVDINRVVENCVHFLDNHIRKSTRNFSVSLAEKIHTISEGYPHEIEQVVVNILMNACQALPDPSRAIHISTLYEESDDCLQIVVEDEGCGITQNDIDHLETPFFTTKRDSGGTGLGLSICNSILKEHGGWLEFESKPGEGTTVRIVLPVNQGMRV